MPELPKIEEHLSCAQARAKRADQNGESRIRKKLSKRPLGLCRGQIWMAPDFDAPMEFVETSEEMELVSERSSTVKKKGKRRESKKSLRP